MGYKIDIELYTWKFLSRIDPELIKARLLIAYCWNFWGSLKQWVHQSYAVILKLIKRWKLNNSTKSSARWTLRPMSWPDSLILFSYITLRSFPLCSWDINHQNKAVGWLNRRRILSLELLKLKHEYVVESLFELTF